METKMEILNRLNVRFAEMTDAQKLEFCRSVKENWNRGIKAVYVEVIRDFHEILAFQCTPEELLQYRLAVAQIVKFEEKVNWFISYLDNETDAIKNNNENEE